MYKIVLLFICFSVLFVSPVLAQGYSTPDELVNDTQTNTTTETARKRFDIGAGYWYTWASLDSYVYDNDFDGQKVSELNNDIDAGLFLINADAWIFWRIHAGGYIAWGDFDGENKDSDWDIPEYYGLNTAEEVLYYYGVNINAPYSISKSDAIGDVTTWNINGYLRVIDKPEEDKGYLDFSLGYFYYQDDIQHLRNSTLIVWDWVTINEPIVGDDSSDKYTFKGLRLGVRGKARLHERVAIKGTAGACPRLNVKQDLFWNLRDDYGPPPGMKDKVDMDGVAYDLDIGLELKIIKHLFVEVGYKYLYLDSDKGNAKRTFLSGSSFEYKDAVDVKAHRGGFYGMARLKF